MNQISIFSQYFYPHHGATSQLITDLAKGLAQRGYSIKVYTSAQSKQFNFDSFTKLKVNYSYSPFTSGTSIFSKVCSSSFFLIFAFFNVLKQPKDIPILFVSNPPYIGILGYFIYALKRGKYYFLFQDIFPDSAVMTGLIKSDGIIFKFFNNLMYLICNYSESIIVLSDSMQKFLAKKYSIPKSKINVIENWSVEDILISSKQENKFAREYDLDQIFTVLYSGNIGRLHDIESIVSAAKILKDKEIRFVFVGDGAKVRFLKDAIKVDQLKNILLLPRQSREILPLSLTACDLSLVSLISGAENIVAPSKLYGMLASGRGIISISSPNSYIDKMLVKYGCGINIPPNKPHQLADIILELSNQPEKVRLMGEQSFSLYKGYYTFERALNEYEEVLFCPKLSNKITDNV